MTEKITHNQINEQETSAYINQSAEMPTVLVRRSNGTIQTGYLDKAESEIYLSKDEYGKPNTDGLHKRIRSPEAVSDREQEKLAAELAGVALRSEINTETIPRPDVINDPFEQLADSVRAEVFNYRRALQNKRESEHAKDFAQAAEDGRAIYRVKQSLSPEAIKFLGL